MDLLEQKEKKLTRAEIEKLFQKVNRPRDWQIRTDSHKLVDRIIVMWFESQGYDFWNNPYPDVIEWTVTKEKEIFFKYVPQS